MNNPCGIWFYLIPSERSSSLPTLLQVPVGEGEDIKASSPSIHLTLTNGRTWIFSLATILVLVLTAAELQVTDFPQLQT
jgi:hypothetical protein